MAWYTINDIDQIDSPALVIYPDRVQYNINLLIGMIGNVDRIRTHVKSHKTKEATLLQMQAGISKFKCATIAEAEMLGLCHAPDVLLAYQPNGPKVNRLIRLIEKFPDTQYACLVDNLHSAEAISVEALQHDLQIPVYIDLNVGMDRTGIKPAKAIELYLQCNQLKGIRPIGLHAYDGHIHDADLSVRTIKANAIYDEVVDLQRKLVEEGAEKPVIIIGGSPTFPIFSQKPEVECSPGTFIYWDANYQDAFSEQSFHTAALIIGRVVSLPDETKVCIDIGHKAIAAESRLDQRIRFLNAPELQAISHSEEHLVVDAGKEHTYKPGDVLYGLPYHVCPTVALYKEAILIENQQIAGEWMTIARNRKIAV